jgi:hypothetical protein
MATALGLDGWVGGAGYRLYLDQLLRNAGSPTDPVVVILLEQLALCHLRSAVLHARAQETEGLQAAGMYNAAAIRLTGECRKLALALQACRSSAASPPGGGDPVGTTGGRTGRATAGGKTSSGQRPGAVPETPQGGKESHDGGATS